jgi:hydroxymethylpyrimidine/phosphomethylpyrimidine kinase
MLGTVQTIQAVARGLDELPEGTPIVVDPVMVSESGAALQLEDARGALIELVLPRATVATPNVPEAKALLGAPGGSVAARIAGFLPSHGVNLDAAGLVTEILKLGPEVVVLTGGHRTRATDIFFDGAQLVEIPGERHPDGAAHGSGCTHSSVMAAQLALGHTPLEAATTARRMAAAAVLAGLRELGAGVGPVDVLGVRRRSADLTSWPAAGSRR